MFNQKLKLLRKKENLSQENLAEIIGVSRQAIAKWETGSIMPELQNLVQLSSLFNVTIDFLVKETAACSRSELTEERAFQDSAMLTKFLHTAKLNTYAAGIQPEIDLSPPYTKRFSYVASPYGYTDFYLGNTRFCGQEKITFEQQPIWLMNYSGNVLDARFSSSFLKESLLLAPSELPIRGPLHHQSGQYVYHCQIDGDIDWFQGKEFVFWNQNKVFELYFHGGQIDKEQEGFA